MSYQYLCTSGLLSDTESLSMIIRLTSANASVKLPKNSNNNNLVVFQPQCKTQLSLSSLCFRKKNKKQDRSPKIQATKIHSLRSRRRSGAVRHVYDNTLFTAPSQWADVQATQRLTDCGVVHTGQQISRIWVIRPLMEYEEL